MLIVLEWSRNAVSWVADNLIPKCDKFYLCDPTGKIWMGACGFFSILILTKEVGVTKVSVIRSGPLVQLDQPV